MLLLALVEEFEERALRVWPESFRVVAEFEHRLKSGAGPGAALGEPHQLVVIDVDLARAESGEAEEATRLAFDRVALVDRRHRSGECADRPRPGSADPMKRPMDVVVPQPMLAADHDIDPEVGARDDDDDAPTASSASDIPTVTECGIAVDHVIGLGAAHHDRWLGGSMNPDLGTGVSVSWAREW